MRDGGEERGDEVEGVVAEVLCEESVSSGRWAGTTEPPNTDSACPNCVPFKRDVGASDIAGRSPTSAPSTIYSLANHRNYNTTSICSSVTHTHTQALRTLTRADCYFCLSIVTGGTSHQTKQVESSLRPFPSKFPSRIVPRPLPPQPAVIVLAPTGVGRQCGCVLVGQRVAAIVLGSSSPRQSGQQT